MRQPSKEQIKKYIRYLSDLETFCYIHGVKFGDKPIEEQKELHIVGKWLNALSQHK